MLSSYLAPIILVRWLSTMLKKAKNQSLTHAAQECARLFAAPSRAAMREPSRVRRAVPLACLCALSVSAQSLETLAASYRKAPGPRTRAAVLHFADLHHNDR